MMREILPPLVVRATLAANVCCSPWARLEIVKRSFMVARL